MSREARRDKDRRRIAAWRATPGKNEVITALRSAGSEGELSRSLRATVERAQSPADRRELGDVAGWVDAQVKEAWTPWLRWDDPAATLAKVAFPVPAVNGGMDMQVAAKPNLRAIRARWRKLATGTFDTIELAGLNRSSRRGPVLFLNTARIRPSWTRRCRSDHTPDPEAHSGTGTPGEHPHWSGRTCLDV